MPVQPPLAVHEFHQILDFKLQVRQISWGSFGISDQMNLFHGTGNIRRRGLPQLNGAVLQEAMLKRSKLRIVTVNVNLASCLFGIAAILQVVMH